MDGTRMGSRSSTRHGPASVFSGPVRRWKKTWAPITSSNPSPVASRVLLYKWVPLAAGAKDENSEEPTTRPIRYLPVSVILAQRKEAARKAAEEAEAAALAKLAAQQSITVGGDSTDNAFAQDPLNPADVKGSDPNGDSEAEGLPLKQEAQEGQPSTDSRDKTNQSQGYPIEEKKMEVEAPSADVEMQDKKADENVSGGVVSRKNEEGIEVLSDSSAESDSEGRG